MNLLCDKFSHHFILYIALLKMIKLKKSWNQNNLNNHENKVINRLFSETPQNQP